MQSEKSFLIVVFDPRDIQERFPKEENKSGDKNRNLVVDVRHGKEHRLKTLIRKESEGKEGIKVKQLSLTCN